VGVIARKIECAADQETRNQIRPDLIANASQYHNKLFSLTYFKGIDIRRRSGSSYRVVSDGIRLLANARLCRPGLRQQDREPPFAWRRQPYYKAMRDRWWQRPWGKGVISPSNADPLES
jgi:hypothetical protein